MDREIKEIKVYNPYNGELVGSVIPASDKDIDRAIERAWDAFNANDNLAIDRYHILSNVWRMLQERREEFARLISLETGKSIRESRIEVDRASTTLHWSAEESLRIGGTILPCDTTEQRLHKKAYVYRVPLGVVGAIVPFNYPLNIPAHKVGPALASGNTVILKPSPKAPMSSERFVKLFYESGLPRHMLQVIHGDAPVTERLVKGNISAVSFTGSTRIGYEVARWATPKKLVLELGGNDPIVVMDDADLNLAVKIIIAHRFSFSGQRCTSCKRLFLHTSIYKEVKTRLLAEISKLTVGDPMDEKTDIGPLIDEYVAIDICNKIGAARKGGAKILCGGSRKGSIVLPTLIEGLKIEDPLIYEETLGPVLPIIKFEDFDEVPSLVNNTPYGLQAGIFTNRIDIIQEAFRRFNVGTLVVNDGPGLRVEPLPFGGVKSSGLGREGIRYAIEEFTNSKTLIL